MNPFEAAVDAIVTGDAATLAQLLREHPDLVHARSSREHHATLLHYVGANGVERQRTPPNVLEIAKILLDAGADVDATADMYGGGSTTLGLVATSVWPYLAGVQNELLDFLLERGANIDQPAAAGNAHNVVNGCLANGRPTAAEHLAARGAQLDLEGAAGVGRLDVVQSLFDSAPPEQIQSGLQWACEYGHTDVVTFLIDHGVPVTVLHRGQTPLHWAAYAGHADIARLLLAHNAPRDVKDEAHAATPLGWAQYGKENPPPERSGGRWDEVIAMLAP